MQLKQTQPSQYTKRIKLNYVGPVGLLVLLKGTEFMSSLSIPLGLLGPLGASVGFVELNGVECICLSSIPLGLLGLSILFNCGHVST